MSMAGSIAGYGWRWMRIESTDSSRASRRSGKSKRRRLENHKATSTRIPNRKPLVLISLLLTVVTSGCVQNSFQVQDAAQTVALKSPLAPEVLMEVDDVAVQWGTGKVGDALKTALVRNGSFNQVHFPIYPSRAVTNKLQIVARGRIESDSGGAFGKSFVTGLLLLAPVGVLQYREVFTVTADVSVIGEGRKFGPITVESTLAADHTMFNGPETYALQAQRMVLEDLANRISASLAEHPEWFAR